MAAVSYWGVECNGGEFHPLVDITTQLNATRPDVDVFSFICMHGGGACIAQEFGPEQLLVGTFPGLCRALKLTGTSFATRTLPSCSGVGC